MAYGIVKRGRGSDGRVGAFKMGVLFTTVAIVFGLLAFWMQGLSLDESVALLSRDNSSLANMDKQAITFQHGEEDIEMPPSQLDTLTSLPEFPVPTPTIPVSNSDDTQPVDTSSVTRIVGTQTWIRYCCQICSI